MIDQGITAPLLSAEAIDYYYDNFVDCVEDQILAPARTVMGKIRMTPDQKDLLKEITKSDRVAVESGHGTGKSCCLSWIAFCWLVTRFNTLGREVKVPCIAPTYHQLGDVLWPEFRRWIPLSRLKLLFTILHDEVFITGYKDLCFIRARSPKEADNLQGFHAEHLLWICDEAFGINNESSWEMIEGSFTTDDNKIIVAGQHTQIRGYCHEAFHKDKDAWKQLRFNSEESPIADKKFAARIIKKYGKDSDIYRVRVLGTEPKGNPDAFISLEKVMAATMREVKIHEDDRLSIGVDCARFGDDTTVVTLVKGNKVFPQVVQGKTDTDMIVDMTIQMLRKYRLKTGDENLCVVNVDATGGFGAGAIDALLKNTEDNIRVNGITFTGKINDEEYFDGVSKMWGELRERIDELNLPDNDFLIEEISARKFVIEKSNRIRIVSKSEYKKDYGDSPDRADSLVLALADKSIRTKVIEMFVKGDCVKDFNIDFTKLQETSVLLAMAWMEKTLQTSVLLAHWDIKEKELLIFDEAVYDSPRAELVIIDVSWRIRELSDKTMRNLDKFEFFGNRLMFGKEMGGDIQAAYRKLNAYLRENENYNEIGSIALINRLLVRNKLYIHNRCEELIRQIGRWIVDKNKPQAGFGLCRALCLIMSVLTETGRFEPAPKPLRPYSPEKTEFLKFADKAMREGVFDEMSDEDFEALREYKINKYGWM